MEPAAAIQLFHQSLHKLMNLAIWKAQFLDRDTLLLKLGPGEQLAGRVPEAPSQHCLAFWHIPSGRISRFFYDSQLAEFYDECKSQNDLYRFRGISSDEEIEYLSSCGLNFTPTPSNSLTDRYLLDRTLELLASSKGMNTYLAKRRLAAAIPYSSQVLPNPVSPFFDPDLFRYDDRNISPIDRVRSSGESTIKFFSRRTGQLVLRLTSNPGPDCPSSSSRFKKYNQWIVHPYLPLALSMQQSVGGCTCNLHYYKAG
jgi:de-etiolated-1